MNRQKNGFPSSQKQSTAGKKASSEALPPFWLNLLSSGAYPNDNLEQSRRIMSLNGIIFVCIMFFIAFGIHTLYFGHLVAAGIDLAATAIFLTTAILLRATQNYTVSAGIIITTLGMLLLYLIIFGGVDDTGYLWSFAFPLVIIFLLGVKTGILVIGVFIAVVILFFATGVPQGSTEYSLSIKYRFIGSFLSISFIAFIAEYVT